LDKAGIDVWGWHVPFCTDRDAAKAEASNVLKLVGQHALDGADRCRKYAQVAAVPRWCGQGRRRPGLRHAKAVLDGLSAKGRGVALSSLDQPALHQDFPFAVFLSTSVVCHELLHQITLSPCSDFVA
jgi:hypothetical protein